MKKQGRGFSILEMLVVVAVIAGMFVVGMTMVRQQANAALRSQMIAEEARDIAQYARALKQYIDTQTASLAVNTRTEIAPSTLVTQGLLPNDFATRQTPTAGLQVGTSPFGQRYRAAIIKSSADNRVRGVIYTAETPLWGSVTRIGLSQDNTIFYGLRRDVAAATNSTHQQPAGAMPLNSSTAFGTGNSYSMDFSAYTAGAQNTIPMTVVPVNFPEFDTSITNPPTTGFSGECIVMDARFGCPGGNCSYFGGPWSTPSCPTTHPVNRGTIPMCPAGAQFSSIAPGLTLSHSAYSTKADPTVGGIFICNENCPTPSASPICNSPSLPGTQLLHTVSINFQQVHLTWCEANGFATNALPGCTNAQPAYTRNPVYSHTSNPRHTVCCTN